MLQPAALPLSSASESVRSNRTDVSAVPVASTTTAYLVFGSSSVSAGAVKVSVPGAKLEGAVNEVQVELSDGPRRSSRTPAA